MDSARGVNGNPMVVDTVKILEKNDQMLIDKIESFKKAFRKASDGSFEDEILKTYFPKGHDDHKK